MEKAKAEGEAASWGRRLAAAWEGGAEGSFATLFFASGGRSAALSLAWAGAGLSMLNDPHGRARAALAIELAAPGWIVSFGSVPASEGSSPARVASLSLAPELGDGDGSQFKGAVRPVAGQQPGLVAVADALDALMGSPSARGSHELGASGSFAKPKRSRAGELEEIFGPKAGNVLGAAGAAKLGGVGFGQLLIALEAQAESRAIARAAPEAAPEARSRPAL